MVGTILVLSGPADSTADAVVGKLLERGAVMGAVYYRRPTRFTFADGRSEADAMFAAAEAQFGLGCGDNPCRHRGCAYRLAG